MVYVFDELFKRFDNRKERMITNELRRYNKIDKAIEIITYSTIPISIALFLANKGTVTIALVLVSMLISSIYACADREYFKYGQYHEMYMLWLLREEAKDGVVEIMGYSCTRATKRGYVKLTLVYKDSLYNNELTEETYFINKNLAHNIGIKAQLEKVNLQYNIA